MPNLDRFGGPAAWDRYCAEREAAYESMARAGSCGQCLKCSIPDDAYFPKRQDVGYCKDVDEFVWTNANPWDEGCEEYEER
ncbi:MAG: hypothetical protein RSG23_05010 [Gordonibacter sp.]|uniref:hypothetical protein n=1 Tax=Gordonibacter sp. TaxID=1968902 RepID=UPI002FC7B237